MDIINRRSGRQVRRDLTNDITPPHRRPVTVAAERPPRPRRGLKRLVILLLILILLGLGAVAGLYLYFKTAPLAGENTGRVNLLVLGVDEAASLSDTLIVVSLDTRTGKEPKLAMISLPRDLYVDIPEFGSSKINAAYTYGQNYDYPGGGVGLAKDTLEENLELTAHHHAVINFESFKDLVDAVGGVEVDVKTAIEDPYYPVPDYSDTTTFSLAAGRQKLDGETALRYARSRQTTTDFDRAARQQQILAALKEKIVSPQTLLNPWRVKKLQKAIEKNVATDLSFRQLAKIYLFARQVEPQHTSRHVIDTSNYLTSTGEVLLPDDGDFSEIIKFINNIFSQSGDTLPEQQR